MGCQVLNSVMYAVSGMSNRGTFTKSWSEIFEDLEFLYHVGYLIVSLLSLCLHEFFYSLLVSGGWVTRGR